MSYTTTLDSLTRDTQVYVDLQYGQQQQQQDKTGKAKIRGIGVDEDNFKDRWISGTVVSITSDGVLVNLERGNSMGMLGDLTQGAQQYNPSSDEEKQMLCKVEQLYLRNPEAIHAADDIITLSYLHEAALLHNLVTRYQLNNIYSYVGPILIALNPYQRLPKSMYGKEAIETYRGQPMGKLSPHVYAMAEDCFSSMMNEGVNQSILVSGESGAGKTETTKFLLSYFAAMGKSNSDPTKRSIEQQVLLSTPLLEAFGNAKTLRNDNSSRFGKFIEIQFNGYGCIAGAFIHTYLLEKSRVTKQTVGERTYHIFYQLCAGCTDQESRELLLGKLPHDFHYLNQSECYTIDDVSDKDTFELTKQAMDVIGITEDEQYSIKKLLAAILHLGNVQFVDNQDSNDSCSIVDEEPLKKACELLQIDSNEIKRTFLTRKIIAGRESYTTPLKVDQAESCRDALSMLLYSRMFDWIVKRMNDNINNQSQSKYTIGVLDIYGFESFEVNSFEQFCINWANEKLQQQYNHHIFKLSQQEYVKEQINWSMLQFNDNQVCLDLIENSPLSILNILDEECRFPKSDEKTFAEKLYTNHSKHPNFQKPRFSNIAFTIVHYADNVTYETTNFLAKNKDYIVPEQVALLKDTSGDSFVKGLFNLTKQTSSAANSSFKFTSVAGQFKESLNLLMDKISKTYPHYIRCIKPNSQKKANLFNFELVLQQLKCGGIHESIRICLEGYPTKKPFHEFVERYKIIAPDIASISDARQACEKLVKVMNIEEESYQFGTTKLFLRSGQIERIEMLRTSKLNHSAVLIQKNVRRMVERKRWLAIRSSAINIERSVRTVLQGYHLEILKEDASSKKLGQTIRMQLSREKMLEDYESVRVIKSLAGSQLQLSSMLERKLTLRLALIVQARYRFAVKRNAYLEVLAEAKSLAAIQKQKEGLELKVEELQYKINSDSRHRAELEEEKIRLEREVQEVIDEKEHSEQKWKNKYDSLETKHNQLKKEFETYKSKLEKEMQVKLQLEMEQNAANSSLSDIQRILEEEQEKHNLEGRKAKDLIAKLQEELKKEKDMRVAYEKKIAAMEQEKVRLKKRKETEMTYEIDKILSYLSGDKQEQAERFAVFLIFEMDKEYTSNIIPTPSFLLYNLINYWKSDIEGSERLFQLIENSLKASLSSSDAQSLPYWFATIASMIQLLSDEHFISSIPQLQQLALQNTSYTPDMIHDKILSVICTDSYITFDAELMQLSELEDNYRSTDPNPFVKFFIQMASVFVKGYSQLIDAISNKIGSLLKVHKIDENYSISSSKASFETVVLALRDTIEQLRKFKIAQQIITKATHQIITFVDITLFNEILLRKDICSSAKATQIRFNVTQLEKEASSWTDTTVTLPLVTQACNLLLCDKKTLLNEKHRMALVPNLNSAQILKILQMYNYSEFEGKIPNEVYSFFRTTRPALVSIFPETSVILDTKEIAPFTSFDELIHKDIDNELPYISFPISVKERLDRMYQQELRKKEQEVSQLLTPTPITRNRSPSNGNISTSTTAISVSPDPSAKQSGEKKKKRGLFW